MNLEYTKIRDRHKHKDVPKIIQFRERLPQKTTRGDNCQYRS